MVSFYKHWVSTPLASVASLPCWQPEAPTWVMQPQEGLAAALQGLFLTLSYISATGSLGALGRLTGGHPSHLSQVAGEKQPNQLAPLELKEK